MARAIKNYTTTVPVQRSLQEISEALAKAGAGAVQVEYGSEARPVGLAFRLSGPEGPLYFKLSARLDGVAKTLRRDMPRTRFAPDRVARIAWRILRDWVLAQLALIDAGAAEVVEVFLPYLQTAGDGTTLYESFLLHGARGALPPGHD